MTVIVFTGPTLSAAVAKRYLDAEFMPPVAQGDFYRAARLRPRAIGIIDGYFEMVPAVWHKEILWALSEGIRVFGSASMGALRAAELHAFGMRGVGAVFEAYRDGLLEDDDEVAVQHGPAELGFPSLSEAMVNIRATLVSARQAGIIDEATLDVLLRAAKARHFSERTFDAMLSGAVAAGVPAGRVGALAAWLPGGRVDAKRDDAIAMLRAMREAPAVGEPETPRFAFHSTKFWKAAVAAADAETAASPVLSVLRRIAG